MFDTLPKVLKSKKFKFKSSHSACLFMEVVKRYKNKNKIDGGMKLNVQPNKITTE